MSECDYIQKKQAQQGKGVRYDEVMAMIRALLIKHGIVMVMRQISMDCINAVEGTKQKVFEGQYELDLVNMDKPEEKVTHTAYAHGMDGGDKAPGKAHTYAAKLMLIKGFCIETGDDEESRSEKLEKLTTISVEQQDSLAGLISGDENTWKVLCNAYKINHLNQIPASKFEEVSNRIKQFKERSNANSK